jgi:hypothetical protein
MSSVNRLRTVDRELEQVVEPLVSYISATNQPRAALRSALSVLLREVNETNRAAEELVAKFSPSHGLPA